MTAHRRAPRASERRVAPTAAIAFCAALIAFGAISAPAAAQTFSSKAALKARQDALYQELLANPDDPRLMSEYARVSADLENFEGAIATLQRLLLFQPDNTAAKVELGALHFAIGSYRISEQYFEEALASPDLDDQSRERIGQFLGEIQRRTAIHRIEAEVIAGAIATDNATFGPSGTEFTAVDGSTLTISGQEQEDVGSRLRFSFLHSYDLQGPNDDRWETEVDFDGRWWSDAESLNFASAALRTGPVLSVDPSITGFKLRPFLEGALFSTDDEISFYTGGGGVEATVTFGDEWSASGEIRALWRAFQNTEDDQFDGVESRAILGLRYAPTRDLAFRLTALAEREDAAFSGGRSSAGGLQFTSTLFYPAPFASLEQKWSIDLSARGVYRKFDAPDPDIEQGSRDQIDLAVGLAHRFQITNTWSLLAEVDYQIREASNAIYEFDALTGGLSVAFRF